MQLDERPTTAARKRKWVQLELPFHLSARELLALRRCA